MISFTHIRRRFITLPPIKFLIRKSKKILLPGFSGLPLFDIVKFFFQQIRKVGLTERAAAIAFNFVMAIPPVIIFICTLIPYLPISKEFINQLFGLIRDVVPGDNNNREMIKFLNDFLHNQRYGLLSIGFILAMFYSSNAMMGIMRAFDKNYFGFKKRTAFQKRKTALRLTFILFLFIFVSLLLLIMQGAFLKWIGIQNATVRTFIRNVRWIMIVLLFLSSVSFIYRYAPFVQKKWKLINPGSILATTLMLLFTILFSYWVNHFSNYNKLYGSIGTILILMLLIYFNSVVLLIGFELNVSISSLKHEVDERNKIQTGGIQSA